MSVLSAPRVRQAARAARLAREHAQLEAARRRTGGIAEFRSIARRTALYELIARGLENQAEPDGEALEALYSLLTEPQPMSDARPAARARDERAAAILIRLEGSGGLDVA